jgi:linoleoyl-CoA desaturase
VDALERAERRAVVGEDLVALGGGEEATELDRALDGDLGRRTTLGVPLTSVAVQSPHSEKLSFDQGGAFMRKTRRDVEQYLIRRRTRTSGAPQLYAKTAVAFALTLAAWLGLVVARPGLGLGFVCLAGLVLGSIITAFCVQHDANHGAYFRTRRANHLMGWTADALLGFSSYTWRVKHNVAHHTYTNVKGYDDDIDQTPFLRLAPAQEPKPWYRLQWLYVWPLYSLMVLRWQTGGDLAALVRGRIGHSAVRAPRRWDVLGLVGGKAVFVGWALVAPLLVYPWWVVLAGYAGFMMAVSLVAATTFQLAHSVEGADTATPDEVASASRPWAVHQVETTVDLCPRNPLLTWAARRPELPDRASPVPAGAAHALRAHRCDRAAQLRATRDPLHVATVAAGGAARACAAPAGDGAPGRAGRDRDGLGGRSGDRVKGVKTRIPR